MSVSFDEPNLVSAAGLLPAMALTKQTGLHDLADEHLSVPTGKGTNAGLKVASLVAGMVAGADSSDDMALLRHGAMMKIFNARYAPSTLGSFLRSFTFGHVRQLDAVASRFQMNLNRTAPLLGNITDDQFVFLDVDNAVIEVHGYQKQGSGYGYSRVRGLNALLSTASTHDAIPFIAAQRLRKGAANSARGAKKFVTEALGTLKCCHPGTRVLCRFDSASYGPGPVSAAVSAGAQVSVTVRMDPEDAWEAIHCTDAIFDEATGVLVSSAEDAETGFAAFSSRKKAERVPGHLVVRRIPELNPKGPGPGNAV